MKLYYNLILFTCFVLLFVFSGYAANKSPDNNIVVTFDNKYSVTVAELHKYVQDWLYYKKFKERSDIYNNALNDMITRQLKRIDFFEKGLDKNEELIRGINRVINEELAAEYFETQYALKYANEENAKKIYRDIGKEVVYQLIELSKPADATQDVLDSLEKKAMSIKSEIENGKNFSTLVKQHSQNQISVKNNGYMPPVGWKQSILDPIGNVVFNLKKNDLSILSSESAFLIVKIVDVKKIHAEPFDSIKNDIISTLRNSYSNAILDEYEKDKKELIDEEGLKWNQAALEQVVQWSNIPDFYKGEYQETFANALANGNNKIILTYNNNRTLDYKEFLRLLDNILIFGDFDQITEEDLKKFALEALRTDLIVKKADSLGLKKNIFHAFTNNNALKNQIVAIYNQAEIESKIPEATAEVLHRFYKENESTLYYQLEKRNNFMMIFDDKGEAEKAAEKIKEGMPFEKVTGNYLVKTYIKERDGEIKSYLNDNKPILGEHAFEMQESEVSEPLSFVDVNNQVRYAIIKCYQIRPEKQLTFNDVKDIITEDFKSYHRRIIENNLEKQLRNKYHPVVNEDVLAQIISPN